MSAEVSWNDKLVCLLKQNQPFLVLNQNLWEKHI